MGVDRPPYRFERLLVAASRLEEAADPRRRPEAGEAGEPGEEDAAPAPPAAAPPTAAPPSGADHVLDLRRLEARPSGTPPAAAAARPIVAPAEGPRPARAGGRSRRGVAVVVAAAAAAVVVVVVVVVAVLARDGGLDAGERADRCSAPVLEDDLGDVDGVAFLVSASACDGSYAYALLEPSDPALTAPAVYVAARYGEEGWEAIRYAWEDDCATAIEAVDPSFPASLCSQMT